MTCPECDNTGVVYFDVDTPGTPHYCGGCSGYPGIAHEPACGIEPCPEGCPVVPRTVPAAGPLSRECPHCGAKPGEPCVMAAGTMQTTHYSRDDGDGARIDLGDDPDGDNTP